MFPTLLCYYVFSNELILLYFFALSMLRKIDNPPDEKISQ